MKHPLIYLLFVFISISCGRNKTDFEHQLTHHKWIYDAFPERKNGAVYNYYTKFYENNKCENFYIPTNTEALSGIDDTSQASNNWNYNETNKQLIIFGHQFKVLSVTRDTIFLQSMKDRSKVILFRYIPPLPPASSS